jgi:hypothetical protein
MERPTRRESLHQHKLRQLLLADAKLNLAGLPGRGSRAGKRSAARETACIITVLVKSWDPDWVRITTAQVDSAVYPQQPYDGQRVGWLTYIADRHGSLPDLPPTCEVTRVDHLGSVILVKSINRPSASVEAHVQELKRLSDVLEKAGMLAPVPAEN